MLLALLLLLLRPLVAASASSSRTPLLLAMPAVNVQQLRCLGANHSMAVNQRWTSRPIPAAPLLAPMATSSNGSISCPLVQQWCYSGADLLPTGSKGGMTLASCCDLCHHTTGCVGIVLTTRDGNPGLTCYLKSKLVRPSAGHCTSGSMGQPFPPHTSPPPSPPHSPPSPPGPPSPPSPAVGDPVQLVHHASGLCLESRQPSGNVEAVTCEPTSSGISPLQRFQFHEDGSITDGFGHCLSIDAGAHGIDANVAATNISCKSSACTAGARCVKWTRGSGGTLQNGQGCVDVGSGGGISGSDVRFEPAAAAARTGPEQAYCNASAPSWGGGVIKIGSVYHMWVITMRNCSDPNDPNIGDPFVDTGKETPLFAPFMYKMHHFTKTGSGQT
jgi:hypothetical protein